MKKIEKGSIVKCLDPFVKDLRTEEEFLARVEFVEG